MDLVLRVPAREFLGAGRVLGVPGGAFRVGLLAGGDLGQDVLGTPDRRRGLVRWQHPAPPSGVDALVRVRGGAVAQVGAVDSVVVRGRKPKNRPGCR